MADDPDNEYAMIDATIVRAHQHSAGARKKKGVNQAIGRSRGGLTTKIHMIVDALGNPLAFSLTGGQVHDITQAETLTAQVQPEAVLGDKGYDADSYIASLKARAIQPIIPPKANRKNKTRLRFRALLRTQSGRRPSCHCTLSTYFWVGFFCTKTATGNQYGGSGVAN